MVFVNQIVRDRSVSTIERTAFQVVQMNVKIIILEMSPATACVT